MRVFAIVDGGKRKAKPCAFLIYEEREGQFQIVILDEVDEGRLPAGLGPYVQQGLRSLDGEQSLAFVSERVGLGGDQTPEAAPQPARAAARPLVERLAADAGRSSEDSFLLREIPVVARSEEAAGAQLAKELLQAYYDAREPGAAAAAGALLKARRKELGWSQSQLAARAGVQQAVVSRTENGVTNPTMGLLEDLARAMGMKFVLELEELE